MYKHIYFKSLKDSSTGPNRSQKLIMEIILLRREQLLSYYGKDLNSLRPNSNCTVLEITVVKRANICIIKLQFSFNLQNCWIIWIACVVQHSVLAVASQMEAGHKCNNILLLIWRYIYLNTYSPIQTQIKYTMQFSNMSLLWKVLKLHMLIVP